MTGQGPATLVVDVLGELTARIGDNALQPQGKAAALLAIFTLDGGGPLTTAALAERLWGSDPPENAAARIHVHISRLRRQLGDLGAVRALDSRGRGYVLRADFQAGDLARMEQRLAAARKAVRAGDPATAATYGTEALALWQEPTVLLTLDTEWSRGQLARLADLHLTALEECAEAMVTVGRSSEVVGVLDAHIRDHPLRERGVRAQVLALTHAGRQSEALEVYERTRILLVEELGVDPSPALQEAHLAVLRQDHLGPGHDTANLKHVHHIPRSTSALVGRSRLLTRVEHELSRTDSRARIVVLVGLGGVGKTRLAAEVAQRATANRSVVWWTQARDQLALTHSLVELAARLGLPTAGDQAQVLVELWHRLGNRDDWLLVLDDCPGPDLVRAVVPTLTSGRVVVTSRYQAWGHVGRTVPVDLLDQDQSVALLLQASGSPDRAPAGELAIELGGLSLALVQAAAYVDQTGMSLTRYLKLYQDSRLELLARALPDDYDGSVMTTWNISFAKVEKTPGAARLLKLCAALADAPVSVDLLAETQAPVDGGPAGILDVLVEDAIAQLLEFSLVTRESGRVWVHPLVRAVLWHQLDEAERSALESEAQRLLIAAAPPHPDDPRSWTATAWWAPHALEIAARCRERDPAAAAELYAAAGHLLGAQAFLEPARHALEAALDCARRTNAPRIELADLMSALGVLLERLGELDGARRLQEQALALADEPGGADTSTRARIRRRLGTAFFCLRDLQPSLAALRQATDILDQLDDKHELGSTLVDLGMALEAAGRFDEARVELVRAIELLESTDGPSHPDSIHARSVLAVVEQDLGNVSTAVQMQTAVVEAMMEHVGPHHPDTAHALDRLGYVLNLADRPAEARRAHERAIGILSTCYGADHVELGIPWTNVGLVLLALGAVEDADQAQERAERIFTEHLGPHHPHTALALRRRAGVWARRGDVAAARELLDRSMAIAVAALGPDHPDVIASQLESALLHVAGPD